MQTFRAYQHVFSGGETSPLYYRPDEKAYYTTLNQCRNAYATYMGSVTKRPGTAMHIPVKYAGKTTRLQRFVNSQNVPYMLEIGHHYMRFHSYDVSGNPIQIVDGSANPIEVVTTYDEADLDDLWVTQSADVLWIFHKAYQTKTLSHTSSTVWALNSFTFKDGPYLRLNSDSTKFLTPSATNGSITVTATGHTPFVSTDVGRAIRFEPLPAMPDLTIASVNATTNIITTTLPHGLQVGQVLVFKGTLPTGATAGTPYYASIEAVDQIKIYTTSAASFTGSGEVDLTSTAAGARTDTTGRQAGWGVITAYTDSAHVTVSVQEPLPYVAPMTDWRLGAFSNTTGWPSTGVFQESRLSVAKDGDVASPVTVWFSTTQGYTATEGYYQPTRYTDNAVIADMAIQVPIASDGANNIRWMSPGAVLSLGAASSEWTISAADKTQALSPTNYTVVPHTKRGSISAGPPLRINASTLFVDRTGTGVREFVYSFETDSYEAEDRAKLVQHLSHVGIEKQVYMQAPHTLTVSRLSDGTLLVIPFIQEQSLTGGALWSFPNGAVESMDVLPTADKKADCLWMVMNRTINGSTVRYIEVMQQPFFQQERTDAWYLDAAAVHTGSLVSTVTGLDHLEGQMVRPIGDGAPLAPTTVTGGTITLPNQYFTIMVGIPYTMLLETIVYNYAEYAIGSGPPTSIGQRQRINRVHFDVYETGSFSAGLKSWEEPDPINLREAGDAWGSVEPLRSGIVEFTAAGSMERNASVIIESSDPVPFTLRGVIIDGRYATD